MPRAFLAAARFGAFGAALLALGACGPSDAPDFSLRDLANQEVSLSSLRGKVVLLSFWGIG